ncbi:retinoid-inducible serine carboxypeptidase-like isoform X2 [Anneissia japonica]|uniref:retinoid-inducible serine carboxypeptidase-like isoform X1 n=1 Tax=Anneissia japonica TaxID=1529436 RepID=UPI001425A047|nr:retinoid-inducible serine carboxypeptidase-like isoform X1 [Anneissia japonica]XP_033108029.1 retinoid-inducible serine carboxypeptidase-like isoform X2 [Anneissia japonica]
MVIIKTLLTIVGLIICLSFTESSLHEERRCHKSIINDDEPDQDWGYVNVRPDAHMFWWLYFSTIKPVYSSAPLVLWLQGGPGGSSTGFGNFEEIGPLDVNLNPRNSTWVQAANVLFIDNPVGSGYSYVTNDNAYTTNVDEIAIDLVTILKAFFTKHSEFKTIPFYIFCESYGGKMTAALSQALQKEIDGGRLSIDFRGLALGDSWISPIDYVNTWGPYLYQTSLLDKRGLALVQQAANETEMAYNAGNYTKATQLWSMTENVIAENTDNVDFYNILLHNTDGSNKMSIKKTYFMAPELSRLYLKHVAPYEADPLTELMNGPIKKKLGIPDNVTWGAQSGTVFIKQYGDFMKPVIDIVDDLLMNTTLKVVVYNGQLDLICDTPGTELWLEKLTWPGLSSFDALKWKPLYTVGSQTKAFVKTYKNFSFYWIMNAGHMVPADAPDMALKMMKMVVHQVDE